MRPVVKLLRFAGRSAHEAFVVTEIEIGLSAVLRYEHLAVLVRAHGARVDIDVGVELEQRNLDAARFKHRPQRGGGDALAQ